MAPSPAVSLLERSRTIRALPTGADAGARVAGTGSAERLAEGKQAALPELDDPAKVSPPCSGMEVSMLQGVLCIPSCMRVHKPGTAGPCACSLPGMPGITSPVCARVCAAPAGAASRQAATLCGCG